MQRIVEWGAVHSKCNATVQVEDRGVDNEVKYVMPKVWVQFTGLREELREFPMI